MSLDPRHVEELARALQQRRQELEDEIREDLKRVRQENPQELAGAAPDSGDASVADLLSDLGSAEMSRDLGELREIRSAQSRIEDGSYGQCLDCGKDITLERLRAQPTARRCVDCQRAYERTHPVPGAPTL